MAKKRRRKKRRVSKKIDVNAVNKRVSYKKILKVLVNEKDNFTAKKEIEKLYDTSDVKIKSSNLHQELADYLHEKGYKNLK